MVYNSVQDVSECDNCQKEIGDFDTEIFVSAYDTGGWVDQTTYCSWVCASVYVLKKHTESQSKR